MRVVASDRIRKLVGASDASDHCPTAQQRLDRGRRLLLDTRRGEVRRVTGADAVTLQREEILDGDGEAGERPVSRRVDERLADNAPHRPVEGPRPW
jgi:hypothetical protein